MTNPRPTDKAAGRYRVVLATPRALPMVLGALVCRQSAMLVLAQVLLIREATDSFAAAGAATAAFTLAQGLVVPLWGRAVDRRGPRQVIGSLGVVDGAVLLALALAAGADAVPIVLVGLAGLAGIFGPPTVPAMRTMWSRLLDARGQLQAAYALEAALTESAFVTGPMLAGTIAAIFSPAAAVLVGAACLVTGSLLFAVFADGPSGGRSAAGRRSFSALGSPAMRVVLAVWMSLGAAFTALDLIVPAFCQRSGSIGLSGVILAVGAAGAMLGGLGYGLLRAPTALAHRFQAASTAFAVALVPLALTTSIVGLTICIFVAGIAGSPLAITTSQLIDQFAPPNAATESFAWVLSAYMFGAALGAQAAGLAVSQPGVGLALLTPLVFASLGTLLACLGTNRLQFPVSATCTR